MLRGAVLIKIVILSMARKAQDAALLRLREGALRKLLIPGFFVPIPQHIAYISPLRLSVEVRYILDICACSS